MGLSRRALLRSGIYTGGALLAAPFASPSAISSGPALSPVIDAHIHLFDPGRPGGVPWPEPGDVIYRPALPQRYEQIAKTCGVVGAIAIEASPLASDNDWVLDIVSRSPVMVGMIGNLIPGAPTYGSELDRLHRNPLFLGIRYGNLWNRSLASDRKKSGFMDGLRNLAEVGLVFETANPDPELVEAILDIAHQLPALTIVVDHLPHAEEPANPALRKAYWSSLLELGQCPNVYAKLSEIIAAPRGVLERDTSFYTEKLDRLWAAFGSARLMYGSDWPNSDHVAGYADTFALTRNYVVSKDAHSLDDIFRKNSLKVYKWRPRRADQQILSSVGVSAMARHVRINEP